MKKQGYTAELWIVVALAVLGQIAWGLENAWFNTFTFDEITTNTAPIAAMNAASALTATVTTFIMGARSDRAGKRKPYIRWGYVIWGLTTAGFFTAKFFPGEAAQAVMVVLFDCVMTFFGSMAYDACFNAWTTDISNETNRGRITSIVQIAPLISGVILAGAGAVIDRFGYAVFFFLIGFFVSMTGYIAGGKLQDSPDLKPNPDAETVRITEIVRRLFSKKLWQDNRQLLLILLAICILLTGFQVSYAYEMIYANNYLGIAKTYATLLTAAGLPVMVAASIITGRLCDSGKGMKALLAAPALFAAGSLLHGAARTIPAVLAGRALLYGGWMMMTVAATAMFKNLSPGESRGYFEGIRMVFMVLIPMAAGPSLGSWLIDRYGVSPVLYTVGGIIGLLAYAVIFVLYRQYGKAEK